jgi:cell wall-associated NlpC family hydrolase
MPTTKDLTDACEQVLAAKASGKTRATVNGVEFVTSSGHSLLTPDPDNSGWCQRTARLAYLAATGQPMPGADCCAGKTWSNLFRDRKADVIPGPWDEAKLHPGDLLFFGGGSVHDCGHRVGHVGIWLGGGRMFQHTSRARLAITSSGPTADQRKRYLGAVRLLPEPAQTPVPATLELPDGRKITNGVSITAGGAMMLEVGSGTVAVKDLAKALGYGVGWEPRTRTAKLR